LNDTDNKVPVNSVQNVCRQLREEYRGRDLLYNKILARDYTFRRQLSLQDRLLEGNMREVQIVGFEDIIKNKDAHRRLCPIIDFCQRNTQCKVRLVFGSWHYEKPNSVVDMVRMGYIIEQALKGSYISSP
jgi:hypothetical protein